MPSQPNPDSPYLSAQLESSLGVKRQPGEPSTTGQPGVTSGGFNFPAPPAVNSAPPGRPPAAPGPQAPSGEVAAAPVTAKPAQPQPQSPQPGGGGGTTLSQTGGLPPGTLSTPTVRPDGSTANTLTPEGQQRYRESVVALRSRLGPMPNLFRHASLPEMPAELGQWNYNVFTGKFTK